MHLPQELWAIILEFLPFDDWLTASIACKEWRELSSFFLPHLYSDPIQLATSRQPFAVRVTNIRKRKLRQVAIQAQKSGIQGRSYIVVNEQFMLPRFADDILPLVFTLYSENRFSKVDISMQGHEVLRWEGDATHRKTFDLRSTGRKVLFRADWSLWLNVNINVNLPTISMMWLRCHLPVLIGDTLPFRAHITRIARPLFRARPTIYALIEHASITKLDSQTRKPDRTLQYSGLGISLPSLDLEFSDDVWYAFVGYGTKPHCDWLEIAEYVIRMQRKPVILRNCQIPDTFCSVDGYIVHSSLFLEFVYDPKWSSRPTITYDVSSIY